MGAIRKRVEAEMDRTGQTVLKERGRIYHPGLGAYLSDEDVGRAAPQLGRARRPEPEPPQAPVQRPAGAQRRPPPLRPSGR